MNWTLKYKIRIILTGITLILILAYFLVIPKLLEKQWAQYIDEDLSAITTLLKNQAELIINQPEALPHYLQPIINTYQLRYLFLLDKNGSVLFEYNMELSPRWDLRNLEKRKQSSTKNTVDIYFPILSHDRDISGRVYFGINKSRYSEIKGEGVNIFFLLTLGLILFIWTAGEMLSLYVRRPLRQLQKNTEKFINGEDFEGSPRSSIVEIQRILDQLPLALQRLQKKQDDSTLEAILQEAETAKFHLSQEIDFMSNLYHMSNDYRKMRNKKQIINRLCSEISLSFYYQTVYLFEYEEEQGYQLRDAIMRGHPSLQKIFVHKNGESWIQLSAEIEDHIRDMVPLRTTVPPFAEQLEEMNMGGNFAVIPVAGDKMLWGVLIAGFVGQSKNILDQDIEKLMFFCNTAGLTLHNADYLENLEEMVQKRTAELERTNRLLNNAVDEKNDFIRTITHDLNAPLRNINGLVDSLYRKYGENLTEDMMDRLGRIRKNSLKQIDMISNLLELSRVQTRVPKSEPVDLENIVAGIVENFEHEISEKNIQVIVHKPMPEFKSDPFILQVILQNLIDNAIKYIPERAENQIEIQAHEVDEFVEIKIKDSGIGIAQEDLHRIFTIFYRASSEMSLKTQGKGVGLAMIKSMVEKMGGEINATSTVGTGSEFRISLPV